MSLLGEQKYRTHGRVESHDRYRLATPATIFNSIPGQQHPHDPDINAAQPLSRSRALS